MPLIPHNGDWYRISAEPTCEPPQPWVDPNTGTGAVTINYGGDPQPQLGRYHAVVENLRTREVSVSEENFGQNWQALAAAVRMVKETASTQ